MVERARTRRILCHGAQQIWLGGTGWWGYEHRSSFGYSWRSSYVICHPNGMLLHEENASTVVNKSQLKACRFNLSQGCQSQNGYFVRKHEGHFTEILVILSK